MKSGIKKGISVLIKGIFAGALALQACFAVVWGILNLTNVPRFPESANAILGVWNPYDGIFGTGYRLLLQLFVSDGAIGVPGRIILYLLQLAICFLLLYLSAAAFFRALSGEKADGKQAVVTAAFLLTNPFYYPLVFSVLPDAVSTAVLLCAAAYAFLWVRKRKEEKNAVFLLPVATGLVMLVFLSRNAFVCGAVFVLLILFSGCVFSAFSKEKEGKTKKILTAAAALLAVLILFSAAFFGNRILEKRYDTVNENYVTKDLREPYFNTLRTGDASVKKFAKEYFSEIFSPGMLVLKEYPLGNTLNSYNENMLWQKTPRLTKYYFDAGRISYPVGLLCLFAGWLLGIAKETAEMRKKDLFNLLFFCGTILITAFCFSFFAGPEYDYRNAMATYLVWGIFAAGMNLRNTNRTLMFLGKDTKWEKQP